MKQFYTVEDYIRGINRLISELDNIELARMAYLFLNAMLGDSDQE